jgi:tetratricopeptide (TPR) repeat protein
MLVEALAIYEAALGPEHAKEIVTLSALAHVEARLGRTVEAAKVFARALAIAEKKLGLQNRELASLLVNRGRATLETRGAAQAALDDGQKALGIVEEAFGRDLGSSIEPLALVGEAQLELGHAAAAADALERALRITEKWPTPSSDVAKMRALLARARR